jgi:hypothetical protein
MDQQKKEIIKKFIEAYNSFDIQSMLLLLHPGIKFVNISSGEITAQTTGINEFEKLANQSSSLFQMREQKITGYKETGNRVTVEVLYRAILAEDLPNGLKQGDEINLTGRSEYIFKDGLIYSIADES